MVGVTIALMIVVGGLAIGVGDDVDDEYEPIFAVEDNPDLSDEVGAYRAFGSNGQNVEQLDSGEHILNITSSSDTRLRFPVNSTPNYRLDRSLFTVEEHEKMSQVSDGYREQFSTPVEFPIDDNWVGYDDVNDKEMVFEGFLDGGEINETKVAGDEGEIYYKIPSKEGLIPTRNGEVEIDEGFWGLGSARLEVSNEDEIELYDPDNYVEYDDIKHDRALDRYKESSDDTSLVPVDDDGDVYPINTGTWWIDGYYQDEVTVVDDMFAIIGSMSEGAVFDDYWLIETGEVTVSLISDYRTITPPDYSSSSQCSYSCNCDEDGCSTCYGTDTEYAEWELGDSTFTGGFDVVGNGVTEQYLEEETYTFTEDFGNGAMIVPVARTNFVATETYGVSSTCPGNSWEEIEDHDVQYTVAGSRTNDMKKVDGTDLEVSAYYLDKDNEDEFVFHIDGYQEPNKNPLGVVGFEANPVCNQGFDCTNPDYEDQYELFGPWSSYPQTLYPSYDARGDRGGTHDVDLDPLVDDHEPPSFRDFMDAGAYHLGADSTITIGQSADTKGQDFQGINLGENVDDEVGDVEIMNTIGGQFYSHDGGDEISGVTSREVFAEDIWGNDIDTTYERVTIEPSTMQTSLDRDENLLTGRLSDPSDDSGIAGRTIIIEEEDTVEVVTDENGEFEHEHQENATRIDATFEGADYRSSEFSTYYDSAKSIEVTGQMTFQAVGAPVLYLGEMISNLMVFMHWIVLLLFLVWWGKREK